MQAEFDPMQKKRVLFTGGGGASSLPLYEHLSHAYDVFFADANYGAIPDMIPLERRCQIPFAAEPGFVEAVGRVCSQNGIDLLVPGVDEELPALAEMHGVAGWPQILLPAPSFVALMLDKLRCADAIKAAGLDVPATLTIDRASEIGYPLIAKPRQGRGSRGVVKLDRPEQAAGYVALYGGECSHYLAQELALGDEYTILVAADKTGSLRAVAQVRAFEKRGITVRAASDNRPEIFNYVQKFHEAFRATGIYNIQCMLTPDGRVLPFEVNPRISTTSVMAIAAGFDPVAMAFGRSKSADMFVFDRAWNMRRNWRTTIFPD